jgi:hypothetical protein
MILKIQILLVAILGLCVSELHAQVPPDFNAKKAAGLITYELDEVIAKLKIEDLESQDCDCKSFESIPYKSG